MSVVKKAEFIGRLLSEVVPEADKDAVHIALSHGWIEKHDTVEADELVSRLDAARITHMFILKETYAADLPDISGAAVLRDLYDCRVCVNHIAQVYLRGLIEAREIRGISKERFLIFDGKEKLSAAEAEKIYRGIGCIKGK